MKCWITGYSDHNSNKPIISIFQKEYSNCFLYSQISPLLQLQLMSFCLWHSKLPNKHVKYAESDKFRIDWTIQISHFHPPVHHPYLCCSGSQEAGAIPSLNWAKVGYTPAMLPVQHRADVLKNNHIHSHLWTRGTQNTKVHLKVHKNLFSMSQGSIYYSRSSHKP